MGGNPSNSQNRESSNFTMELSSSDTSEHVIDSDDPLNATEKILDNEGEGVVPDASQMTEGKVSSPSSLMDRILDSSSWKVRNQAYLDLSSGCMEASENDDESYFMTYNKILKHLANETSPLALDSGLQAIQSFAIHAPLSSHLDDYVKVIMEGLIKTCYNSSEKMYGKANHVVLQFCEDVNILEVVSVLLQNISNKKPKVPTNVLRTLRAMIDKFGVKQVPIAKIIQQGLIMNDIFQSANGNLREVAVLLVVDIASHLSSNDHINQVVLERLFGEGDSGVMRSTQKEQYSTLLAEKKMEKGNNETMTFTLLKNQDGIMAEMNSNAAAVLKEGGSTKASSPSDVAAEEVVVVDLAVLVKKVSAKVNEDKWASQHDALSTLHEELASSTSVTLKENSSQDVAVIVEWAKKLLRSGHVTVQIDVLKVIGQLCLKCKAVISGHIRGLMQSIASKIKEKRLLKTVVETLTEAVSQTCSLDTVLEDVVEMVTNKKTPAHARDGLLEFLQHLFAQYPARIVTDHLKALFTLCLSSCKDAESSVRDKSVSVLQSIFALCGERSKETHDVVKLFHALEKEDNKLWGRIVSVKKEDIVATKVESIIESSSPQKTMEVVSGEKEVDGAKEMSCVTEVAADVKVSDNNNNNNSNHSASASTGIVSSTPGLMPYDDARSQLSALSITDWGDWFEATMKGTKWQDKVKCMENISSAISNSNGIGSYSAAVVSYLSAHTSKFKSNNINLTKSAIRVLITLVSQCQTDASTFHRGSAIVVINSVSEKLNEKKVKSDVMELLNHFAETSSIGTSLVLNSIVDAIDSCKIPALYAAYLEFLKEHIRGHVATSITGENMSTLKRIALCCESGCEHKMTQVKSMSAELMAVLYHHLGLSQWQSLLPVSLQSKHRKAFDVACEKIGVSENITVLIESEKKGGPRKSFATLVSKNILREINTSEGKNAWQIRKKAFESIIEVCNKLGGYLLEYNKFTDEVLRALKFKLQDTQANNKPVALTAIASILINMEVESTVKALRTVGSALVLALTDNKRQMRDAAILNLQRIVQKRVDVPCIMGENNSSNAETVILIVLVPGIIEALSHSNTVARLPLLTFLITNMNGFSSTTPEVQELVAPLIQCLMDKTSDVRVAAEEVLCDLVGRGCITDQGMNLVVRDLSEAAKRTISTAIERILRHVSSDGSIASAAANEKQMESQTNNATDTSSKSPVKSTLSAPERVKNSPAKFGAAKRIPLNKKSSTVSDGSISTTAVRSGSLTPTKSSDATTMKKASSNSKSLFQSPMKSKNTSASGAKGNTSSATKAKGVATGKDISFSTPPSSPSRKSSGGGKEAEKKKKSVPKTCSSASKSPLQTKDTNHEAHLMKSMSEVGSLSRSSQSSTVLMYKLVSEKMQSLIDSQASRMNAGKSVDAEAEAFEETLRESTVDHIKLLNSLIDGASPGAIVSISTKSSPTKNTSGSSNEEEGMGDRGLLEEANLLMVRLLSCLDIAFPQSNLIDVSLASASLSAIFALLKSTGVVNVLYAETRRDLLHHCLGHMVDDRLGNGSGSDFMEATTAKQINRALNIIALKLSADLGNLSALSTLLSVLQKLVITSSDLDASKMISANASSRNRPSIKVLCTKPASKLLLKILSAEQAIEEPFHINYGGREEVLSDVISQLAKVFECVQSNAAYMENEVIFSCAKTVLSAIIKPTAANFDASKNVLILMDKLKISSNHFMTQLLLRLDRNSKQQQEAEKGAGDSKKSSVKKSNGLMFDVLSLQDEMKLQREAAHNVVNDNGSTSPAIIQHVTDTLPSPPPRTSLLTVVKEDQENAENQSSDNGSTSQPVEKGEDKLTNMMQGLHVSSPDSPTKTSTAASDLMSRIARLKALSDQKGISNVTN